MEDPEEPLMPDNQMGSKSIGLLGGAMLLANNLAGPTISLMPNLTHGAGWLAVMIVMTLLAVLSGACGFLLLSAMQEMPGNSNFQRRVEFADILKFYMHPVGYALAMTCYFAYLIVTLMSYIIQTAQVLDYQILNIFGCAYGIELWPHFCGKCGTELNSNSPFGESLVFSASFVLLAIVCVPLTWKNLDDNVVLQWVAIIGLCVLAVIWLVFLVEQPTFPEPLPALRNSPSGWQQLFSVMLFNFALMSALPSWANEKRPEVSVSWSFILSMSYVAVLYSIIGIVGSLSLGEQSLHGNLFSMINARGSTLSRLSVTAYPILQNLTSIPVFSIFLKYNLMQLGWLQRNSATIVAFVLPWALSVPFYGGDGFQAISNIGGLAFSSVINFLVPVMLGVLTLQQSVPDRASIMFGASSGVQQKKRYGT